MFGKHVIIAAGLALLTSWSAQAQTTLYVNAATGDDNVTRAANSPSTPWRSIGRAAWGSTNRNAPVAGEAAQAGDTVLVAAGTYAFTGTVSNRFSVIYNPVNNGASGRPITFTCVGVCTLTSPSGDAPIIGSTTRSYVTWFADVSLGHSWMITACGRLSGCSGAVVNTTADTGPVVCHASTGCTVEGATIDGGPGIDYADNWNAIRLENCTACVIRNNRASNFTRDAVAGSTNHNQSIITLYGSLNSIIEHNTGSNAGAGVYFKDTTSTNPQSGNHVRYNWFDNVNEVIAFSVTAENRNFVYQNVGRNGHIGLAVVGGGLQNDWVFNNTFYRMALAAVAANTAGSGGRFWNNVCYECNNAVNMGASSMVPQGVIDLEHNVYYAYQQFYAGAEGTRTLASFRSAYPDQEQAAPASIDANPLFVNAAAGDFRLCTGAGAPAAGCTSASPALAVGVDLFDFDGDGNTAESTRAGAYVNNGEIIGVAANLPRAPTNLRVIVGQ